MRYIIRSLGKTYWLYYTVKLARGCLTSDIELAFVFNGQAQAEQIKKWLEDATNNEFELLEV